PSSRSSYVTVPCPPVSYHCPSSPTTRKPAAPEGDASLMTHDSDIPADRRYTEEHEWALREADDVVLVGITDYAQHELGDVVYAELPAVGTQLSGMAEFGAVESVKAASDLFAPVTGEVVDTNTALVEQPELINDSPYDQ